MTPGQLCDTRSALRHQVSSVTPGQLCNTRSALWHQVSSVTPGQLCNTRSALWHQVSSVTPGQLCDTRSALWHQVSSVTPGQLCKNNIFLEPSKHKLISHRTQGWRTLRLFLLASNKLISVLLIRFVNMTFILGDTPKIELRNWRTMFSYTEVYTAPTTGEEALSATWVFCTLHSSHKAGCPQPTVRLRQLGIFNILS